MVSKVVCFALLACTLGYFVPATAKPLSILNPLTKTGGAIVGTYLETRNQVITQVDATKSAATKVWDAGVQGVKTIWQLFTSPLRFAGKLVSNIGKGMGLSQIVKKAARDTLADNEKSIVQGLQKILDVRSGVLTAGLETGDATYKVLTAPIRAVKDMVT